MNSALFYPAQRGLVALAAALAVGAVCAQRPLAVPPTPVVAAADTRPPAASAQPASLRDLLARSVPWDPQVRTSAATQAVAQERLAQSKSRLWPTLGLSVNAGESNDADFGLPVKRRIERSELLLRWNLYNGGADAAEISATEREWAAATADLSQAMDLVCERIGMAYLDAWRWQSLIEPSMNRLQTIERWVEQARVQLRAGRLSDADVQQAEYSLVDAQLSHQVLVSEWVGALASLQVYVGEPVSAVAPQTLPRLSAEEAQTMVPAGIRVAQLRAQAAKSRVLNVATLAALRVDLDARKRLSDNTTPRATTSQRDSWSVGMRWEMPLGGETFSRRREAVARAEGAQAEIARLEQGLRSELASMSPRIASAEQAIVQLQSQAEQYNTLLRAGRVQFDAGRRSLQQLIQLEDGRINVIQRLAEQNNRLDRLRLRMLVLAGRLSGTFGIDPAPAGTAAPKR